MRLRVISAILRLEKLTTRVLARSFASASFRRFCTCRRSLADSISMKSMTTWPPSWRSRSCLAISSQASRLVLKTVRARLRSPVNLAVLTSIETSASVSSIETLPPLGSQTRRLIKLLDLFFQPVFGKERLFTAKPFDSVDKMGGEFAHQIARAVIIF